MGLSSNDRLKGLNGDDDLFGGAGNDILVEGRGEEVLTGGLGRDRFLYASPNQAGDRIVDFSNDVDDIFIAQKGFRSGLTPGLLPANRFVLGNRAQDRGDRFIYNRNRGQLFFDPDGSGSKNARLLATFDESPMLGARDIVIF